MSKPDHAPWPPGLLLRAAGGLLVLLVLGAVLAVATVLYYSYRLHTAQGEGLKQAADSMNRMVHTETDRLRTANRDGILTDQEIRTALLESGLRSIERTPSSTLIVAKLHADAPGAFSSVDASGCYLFTARTDGTVTAEVLPSCPPPTWPPQPPRTTSS
ncbi:hypothetical protein ACIQGZ_22320 [Streptomyces sp. NPDC092296]|uniref:hypothetical protein n=1 Tax=Streptomyces sp. NPDC092296 TaxID=3366012 RepID=UPI00380F59C5